MKVLNRALLLGVPELKLFCAFTPVSSSSYFYKFPKEKHSAELQLRVVHGAVATNKSLVSADIRMEFIFFKMAGEVADFGNFLSVRGKRICVQC